MAAADVASSAAPRTPAVADEAVVVTEGHFRASDGQQIGYVRRERQPLGSRHVTVLLLPGLSGTAAAFSEWFEPLARLPQVHATVAIDWRGFGSSRGPWTPCAPPGGEGAPSYASLTTWRLARDVQELITALGIENVVIFAHSLGVHATLEFIQLHGTAGIAGLILVDQAMRNMAVGAGAVDETFPASLVTFKPEQLEDWLPQFTAFDKGVDIVDHGSECASRSEIEAAAQPYAALRRAMLSLFHAADEPGVSGSFMTQTTRGLLAWMRAAGACNGKVFARLMTSAMLEDVTGMASVIRDSGLPVLWYGGENSIVPLAAIEWSARAMASRGAEARTTELEHGSVTEFGDSAHVLLAFRGTAGNHCPWLNEDGSEKVFMDTLVNFLKHV